MNKTISAVLCLFLLLTYGCRPSYVQEVPNIPLVDEILLDTTSKHYVDFSSYPDDISQLPIGILTTFDECEEVSHQVMTLDCYNNITGTESPDEILDFAGEHFCMIALRDTLSGNLLDTAVIYTAKLLQRQVKAVILACPPLSEAGFSTLCNLLRLSGKKVMVIGMADSSDYSSSASICYKLLRNERNLALRITQQELQLQVIPETECTPLQ